MLALLTDLHAAAQDQPPVQVLEAELERTGYAIRLASRQDGPARLKFRVQ